ncbi:MAG: helix-turn-helix domain-containing protein, partial [Octadecabacter sp.]|nr:helix-turn-helix domain-containing protein [Octadecabacter sp.]
MMRGRAAVVIDLSGEQRAFLETQLRRHKATRSLFDRCRFVLRCAVGLSNKDVATELGHSEHTVGKWRQHLGPTGPSVHIWTFERTYKEQTGR